MITPELEYIGWHAPAIELVAKKLMDLQERNPQEFRRAMVVVPTAESGRSLREYMAELAGRPVLMPRFTLAGQLIPCEAAAGELETMAAWLRVLGAGDATQRWPHLFPHEPRTQTIQEWAFAMTEQLRRERAQLEQACCAMDNILSVLPPEVSEQESARWKDVQNLFAAVDDVLEQIYRCTPREKARREAIKNGQLPAGMRGRLLIFACVPEMSAQTRVYLQSLLRQGVSVQIWVNAPSGAAAMFDSFGCPNRAWETRELEIEDDSIHVVQGAAEMALLSVQQSAQDAAHGVSTALCVADARFAPELICNYRLAGRILNVPEGRGSQGLPAVQWVQQLQTALNDTAKSAVSVLPLLRNAAVTAAFGLREPARHELLRTLDEVMKTHLPSSRRRLVDLMTEHLSEKAQSEALTGIMQMVERAETPAQLADALQPVAHGLSRACSKQHPLHAIYRQVSDAVLNLCSLMRNHAETADWQLALPMLNRSLSRIVVPLTRREQTAADALGWMEMPYTAAPSIQLLGFHEHCVPEEPAAESLLPDSLREQLDMDCVSRRVRRDSFILASLLHRRGAKVQFVVAQQLADGTPIIPSRLLSRFGKEPGEAFARRVQQLFCDLKPGLPVPPPIPGGWHLGDGGQAPSPAEEHISQLRAGAVSPWAEDLSKPFSPSAISAFLSNPLLFWLKSVLKMDQNKACDDDACVLPVTDFGNIAHEVLKRVALEFCKDSAAATVDNIRDYARAQADELFAEKFGTSLSLEIKTQKRMLQNRLYQFAPKHAADLAAGWEPQPEFLEEEQKWQMAPDVFLSFRMDRVDRHAATGEYRVIDYKTHSKKPEEKHLASVPVSQRELFAVCMPGFPLLETISGKSVKMNRWTDVQLPLYAAFLMERFGLKDIPKVAYYNIPRGSSVTGYNEWAKMDKSVMESAMTWAHEAIRLIRAGRCLVSPESWGSTGYGDFAALAPLDDPRNMVALPPVYINN